VHVIEVSSFQIDLAPSLAPSIGALLNLTPDHLDRHGTLANYAAIKERLVAKADLAVIGTQDAHCREIAARLGAKGRGVIRFAASDAPPPAITIEGREIRAQSARFDLSGARALRGAHNARNAAAAIAIALALKAPPAEISASLPRFPGLAHRLQEIGRVGRIALLNDSKATNAESTEQALASFEDGVFWIAGGRPKAGGIARLIPFFPRIAKAYLIGEAMEAFAETLFGHVPHSRAGTLEIALSEALGDAEIAVHPAPVILFSPSCASFDQFENFAARGEAFCRLARALPGFRAWDA
jgi:UDP-N-acetylmuramoylalanine--D-glutamate ligase